MSHRPERPVLLPPVAYQGGKQRIAEAILDVIRVSKQAMFYDLCCGSGAITFALINRGHDPERIVMVDSGPFGMLWEAIGAGTFSLDRFEAEVRKIPTDPARVQSYVAALARYPLAEDAIYIFPILQAASFGGKAVGVEDGRWKHHGFRSLWLPTATSNRRSSVNPMMPMPDTLLARMKACVPALRGVRGMHKSLEELTREPKAVVYIDPPYTGTTSYLGSEFDLPAVIQKFKPAWVSEGRALSPRTTLISSGRRKGGISGERRRANEECLSLVRGTGDLQAVGHLGDRA